MTKLTVTVDETRFEKEIEELFLEYYSLVSKKSFSSKEAFKMMFRRFIRNMNIGISVKK
jgi:hypothetical protein